MKKIYNILIALFIVSISIVSCKKEMIDYLGPDGIFFSVQPRTPTGIGDPSVWPMVDTSAVPFAKTKLDDSTYVVKVKVLGSVADYDRKFGIEILNTSTVVEGRDFDKLNREYSVLAGDIYGYIPITFHRTEEMKVEDLYLTLKLIESSDFRLPFEDYIQVYTQSSDTVKAQEHTIKVSDKLYKPTVWSDFQSGTYSDAKMQLICDLYDVTIDMFDSQQTMPNPRYKAIMLAFKNYLAIREEEGNPVYETDYKGNIIYEKDANGEYKLDENGQKIPVKMSVGTINI